MKRLIGILLAVMGFFWYTHLQLASSGKNERKEDKEPLKSPANGKPDSAELQEIGRSSTSEKS